MSSGLGCGAYLSSGFLYLNLGCHMMFVLKNRLKAQGIAEDKYSKIINDLAVAIFRENFIKTVLTPQDPMGVSTLKQIFRKLAHSSIMKLDQSSMEKLLYLIIMTVKKEFFLVSSPLEIFSLTLGNLQCLGAHVVNNSSGSVLLETIIAYFVSLASNYSFIQYHQLKEHILTMLETYQTKVVNFVESGQQNQKGKLIFMRRNKHIDCPLGKGVNHPNVKLSAAKQQNIQYLALVQWRNWKSSLVLDHAKEYQIQTQKRNLKSETLAHNKEKGVNQLFEINAEILNNIQVQFDLFEYEQDKKEKPSTTVKSNNSSVVVTSKSSLDASSKMKTKIQSQFSNLQVSKQEEQNDLDLLEMMDQ